MDAIDGAAQWVSPKYRRAFSITDVTGTWIPMPGSDPFIGEEGLVSYADEKKIECIIKAESLERVLKAIDLAHPYEEPAVDVLPCKYWRDYCEE